MTLTRRSLLVSVAATAAAQAQRSPRKTWKPKLGILGKYTPGNVAFAKQEGFSSIGLWANPKTMLDPDVVTGEQVEKARVNVRDSGLYLSVIGAMQNHIAPDPEARGRANASFGKVIELAGKMGAPFVGTSFRHHPR
jgi:sugar phosphate isomerase/epimerase